MTKFLDIDTTDVFPEVVRVRPENLLVGQVHVFQNNNGTYSLEKIRAIDFSNCDVVNVSKGPTGHSMQSFNRENAVEILRESLYPPSFEN